MTNCQEHGEYSCLMSVYDGESASNLRRSLQSVFDQTVPPFEFVVVSVSWSNFGSSILLSLSSLISPNRKDCGMLLVKGWLRVRAN